MSGHRWSGWPGAYCQDCFIEDLTEVCIADCPGKPCVSCEGKGCKECSLTGVMPDSWPCSKHLNPPCPGPSLPRLVVSPKTAEWLFPAINKAAEEELKKTDTKTDTRTFSDPTGNA